MRLGLVLLLAGAIQAAPAPPASGPQLDGTAAEATAAGPETAEPAPAEPIGVVRVGRRAVVTLHVGIGLESAAERGRRVSRAIESVLLDPACSPESWAVRVGGGTTAITACDRPILAVTEADAVRERTSVEALSARWLEELRLAFGEEKQVLFSARLLRRAILGLLLPLGFLTGLALVTLLERRVRARLELAAPAGRGMRLGPLRLLETEVERRVAGALLRLARLAGYVALTYGFVIILFRQFPATARWAGEMLEPVRAASGGAARFGLVLVAVVLILVALRAALRWVGRLFTRVKRGDLRVEPFLSAETAGPAELMLRAVLIAIATIAIGVLVPGQVGAVLLGLVAVGLVAVAFGAAELAANLLAGVVSLYGRPFRSGQTIRIGSIEGVVGRKGLLHLRVESPSGRIVLVPNRLMMTAPLEILGAERALVLRLTVESPSGPEAACGLVRHATAAAGWKRDEVEIHLVEVAEGRLVLDAVWPLERGGAAAEARSQLIEALIERAPGLEVRLVSVAPRPAGAP